MPRFSDGQLLELRKDFDHHLVEEELRWSHLADMVEKNTQATERIAEAVERQAESTAGVVQLYTDFRGAAHIGVGLQKFLAWLIALGTFGAAVAAAITYVLDKFMPGSAGP